MIAAGGDTAISPDNIDTSEDYLMINEDGTAQSRVVMAAKNRDGSIWRFRMGDNSVSGSSARRIAELDPPGRDGIAVGPGIWETSGIIDTSKLYGDKAPGSSTSRRIHRRPRPATTPSRTGNCCSSPVTATTTTTMTTTTKGFRGES